jgi:hypothetical protein
MSNFPGNNLYPLSQVYRDNVSPVLPITHLPKIADLGANDHTSVRMQALPRYEAAISTCQEHKASRNL